MPVIARSQARKNQEELRNSISKFKKQQIMKHAADKAVRLIKAASLEKEEKEFESRFDWFKKYVQKTMKTIYSQHPASSGMEKLRLTNELFHVVDEYIHEILHKKRNCDRVLMLACVIYNKAIEFYCGVEETMKKYVERNNEVEVKFVENFVKKMGIVLSNMEKTFEELDLVKLCEWDDFCDVMRELKRVEDLRY